MLKVYKAKRLKQVLALGGRTKPWLIEAELNGETETFVMKLFTTPQIDIQNSVCAEVLGNVLAKEFGLPVPEAVFIEITDEFKLTLGDKLPLLDLVDERPYKFATVYKPGCVSLTSGLGKEEIENTIDIEVLFAFDNLIRNRDRSKKTPNMLIDAEANIWLIDHEMAFHLPSNIVDDFNKGIWHNINQYNGTHFLVEYLKDENPSFASFHQDYLQRLNFKKILLPYFQQLEMYDYTVNSQQILSYLTHIQANTSKFISLIKQNLI